LLVFVTLPILSCLKRSIGQQLTIFTLHFHFAVRTAEI